MWTGMVWLIKLDGVWGERVYTINLCMTSTLVGGEGSDSCSDRFAAGKETQVPIGCLLGLISGLVEAEKRKFLTGIF
jgi:hypothetical protein